jgi:hypothetical protein
MDFDEIEQGGGENGEEVQEIDDDIFGGDNDPA